MRAQDTTEVKATRIHPSRKADFPNHVSGWLICASVLLLSLMSAGKTLAYPDSLQAHLLIESQQALFNDRFDQADSLAEKLRRIDPDDPGGYFAGAVSLLARMFDYEEEYLVDSFKLWIDRTAALARQRIDSGVDSHTAAWMYNYVGNAKSYRSLYESRFGSFTGALRGAISARNSFEEGIDQDSTAYDLYLGLGLYHYWKSAKAGFLRTVGLFKNEMDKGIAELRLATDSSLVSCESARNALIWIWLDREQYDSTITVSREMAQRYSDGKVFLWPLAEAYYKQKMYDSAATVYERIRDKLLRRPGNFFNLIEVDHKLVTCRDKQDCFDDARELARRALEYFDRVPDKIAREKRSEMNFIRRLSK